MVMKRKCVSHTTARVLLEESPIGDSQSNGAVERANATVQGLVRTIKDYTERMINTKMPLDSACLKWLIKHVGWLLSAYKKGSDGQTAEERLRLKPFKCGVAAFGEQILYLPHKAAGIQKKLESKWKDGVWLGINARTSEAIIGDGAEVVLCRSVRRRAAPERWNAVALLAIRGTPWNLKNTAEQSEAEGDLTRMLRGDIPMQEPAVAPAPPTTAEPIGRRIYITKRMVTLYGTSDGCPGCRIAGATHTETCRKRMSGRIEDDPNEKWRLNHNKFANEGKRPCRAADTEEDGPMASASQAAASSTVAAQSYAARTALACASTGGPSSVAASP